MHDMNTNLIQTKNTLNKNEYLEKAHLKNPVENCC